MTKNIGFLGGGNMGSALIRGIKDVWDKNSIYLYEKNNDQSERICMKNGIKSCDSEKELLSKCDIIILAIKPNVLLKIIEQNSHLIKNQLIVSIAAGITINSIESKISNKIELIRVMPNTPSLIGHGMSVLSPNSETKIENLKIISDIFKSVGEVITLPETQMDAVTGLSGSGPAFVYTFIQGLIDGGVKMGLTRDVATKLATQTVIGSAAMISSTEENPITLRGRVTSPNGTTIEGVHILEKGGFSGIVMDAVEGATLKSIKLGKN